MRLPLTPAQETWLKEHGYRNGLPTVCSVTPRLLSSTPWTLIACREKWSIYTRKGPTDR
jgi:hypothetical protein